MAELVKLVYCVRKRADMSDEDFRDYWLNRRGPLVRSLWEKGTFPGMVRYVQSHTDLAASESVRASRGAKPPYDGITEVWMDPSKQRGGDEAAIAASAEGGKRLLDDESTFIDFANSAVFITREHTIFE